MAARPPDAEGIGRGEEHRDLLRWHVELWIQEARHEHLPDDGGAWGLVVGRFAKGDEKALEFRAGAGETYSIVGIGLDRADVDIRLFGPGGELIGEDVLDDHVPVVIFTAEASGVYRAVMSAAAVGSGGSYAGMVVLRPPAEEGACGSAR